MEDNINNIKNLLNQVSLIKKNYDKINEITGANYNIFHVMKLRSDEVRLHSRFLGDMLSPNGKHGRGDVFLRLFVEKLIGNIEEILKEFLDTEQLDGKAIECDEINEELFFKILQEELENNYKDIHKEKQNELLKKWIKKRLFDVCNIVHINSDPINLINVSMKELAEYYKQNEKKFDIKKFVKFIQHTKEKWIRINQLFFSLNSLKAFDFISTKVIVEKYIGKKTDDDGGRIDLVIEDGQNQMVIENKIFALDQPNQLLRYHNHYPTATLVYLTLYGKEASDFTTGDKKFDKKINYFTMSYFNHIKEWLEDCLKETAELPLLRETLKQYINTIKSLTGQSINKEMEKDIIDVITKSEDNFLSANLVKKNYKKAKDAILLEFRENLQKKLEEKLKGNKKQYCVNIVCPENYKKIKLTNPMLGAQTQFLFSPKININKDNRCKDNEINDKLIFEFSRMKKSIGKTEYEMNNKFYFGFRFDNENNNDNKKYKSEFELFANAKNVEIDAKNKWWIAKKIWEEKLFESSDDKCKKVKINKFGSIEFIASLANNDTKDCIIESIADEMYKAITEYLKIKQASK